MPRFLISPISCSHINTAQRTEAERERENIPPLLQDAVFPAQDLMTASDIC